ncbi:MAG: hypothetical protein EOO16_18315 [Chitinophagaceae bacterium]|nr:MAG: hypothetical protein EOO16_18315 [Chitinophagaceae bacterium]
MPAILLTNNRVSIPTMRALRDRFQGVYTPIPASDDYAELTFAAAGAGLPLHALEPEALFTELHKLLQNNPELVVISFGFPLRIPASFLADAGHRFYNVHFSLLPRYAGPVPVFWQLRAGDPHGGVTVHQVSERMDAGPVAAQQAVNLFPGETYGLYNARLTAAAVPLVQALLDSFANGDGPQLCPQDTTLRTYQHKPREKDLLIDWDTQPAAAIEHLVNACNPIATGAWTWFRGQPLQIIEVSPAEGSLTAPAGTIVHADPAQGLFVCCCDGNLLRINVAKLPEGILSGGKLAAIGFRPQERFDKGAISSPATVSH